MKIIKQIILFTHRYKMEGMINSPHLSQKEAYDKLLTEKGKFRISPMKYRQSMTIRKPIKPFSSSIIQERKPIPTKQDLLKMNSKLQLIKKKCMQLPKRIKRSDSKKTIESEWLQNEQLNESVDFESQSQKKLSANSTKIHLLRSRFEDRPPTIFFFYPKCCGIEADYSRVISSENATMSYKIVGSEYRCIVNSLEFNGFQRIEGGPQWNILFDLTGIHHQKALQNANKYQKISHFPGCWQLGRKDYMWKNLNKQRRAHPEAYNFVPMTYLFPSDFDRFEIAQDNAPKDQLWIMKPTNQACGRGIKMVGKDTKVKGKKDTLVSEYIANPHLINGYKYDLRIYVLVTSYDPLRIYMFKEGLTRFATYEYNTKQKNIKKRFIHLTNFSVNKHSKKYVKNSKTQQDGKGSKWSLSALKTYYEEHGIDSCAVFESIKDIIIKTCISAEPVMLDIHSKTQDKRNCGFEIYGFDILIDSKLKPWLMQVNVCPSLSSSSPMDRRIKHTLLTDTLNLIGMEYQSKKSLNNEKKKEKLRLHQKQQRKYFSKNINNLENLNINTCIQILSPQDWLVLFESCEELQRAGHFERIFPLRHNVDTYKSLFEFNRYHNYVLWRYLKSDYDFLNKLYQ